MEINSLGNAKVKNWVKLKEKKHRDTQQLFLVEGEHLLEEAQSAGILECVILKKGDIYPALKSIETYEVSEEILHKLTSLTSQTTLLGVCRYPIYDEIQGEKFILLDNVQDPGNLGTIIRSAYSFGFDGIVLSPTCVDCFNDKVIRSTQGALFHIPVYRENLKDIILAFQARNIHIYATSLHQALPLASVQRKKSFALIFGNEGQGVSDEILALSDERIIIEMKAFESLNVAVAASICMYTMMDKAS